VAKHKKIKPKAKPVPPAAGPEEAALARAWLDGLARDREAALARLLEAASSQPDLARAMILGLAGTSGPEAGWVAGRASAGLERKELRKAAKKALYQLRQRGVPTEVPERSGPVFKPASARPARAHLSGYFPDGRQLIVLAFPQARREGRYGLAIHHFETGLERLDLAPMSSGQFREMLAENPGDLPWPRLMVEGEDLVWLLGRLIQAPRSGLAGRQGELFFLAQWLEEQGPPLEEPPLYRRLGLDPAAEPEPGRVDRLRDLIDEPPCLFWSMDPARWERVRPGIEAGSGSNLILSPGLTAQREAKALRDAAETLFPLQTRRAWRTRLEETALFPAAEGKEESALAFLEGAKAMDRADHPLLLALIRRQLELEKAEENPAGEDRDQLARPAGSGLILPPPRKG